MVTMRAVRTGPWSLDVGVGLVAGLITGHSSVKTVAAWLPHDAIILLAVAQGVMLLGRRRTPTAVLAGTTAVGVLLIVAGYPAGSAIFGACCAAYAMAVYGSGDEGAGLAVTLRHAAVVAVAAIALGVASLAPGARGQSGTWTVLVLSVLVAAPWVLGYAIRTRRAYIAELKARAARLEAEEGERAARAVVDERLRIARELHDVIGHSISLIAIQSEAAARSARSNPDAVPAFLSRISAASRQALAEMRGVLAVLRPDAAVLPDTVLPNTGLPDTGLPTTGELSPQPGLEQVAELVASLRADGLETRLEAEP